MESASCGPSNPLKNLSTQFDRNSLNSSSTFRTFPSSNQTQFRSQRSENSSLNHEFAQFNSPSSSSQHFAPPSSVANKQHVPYDGSFLVAPHPQEYASSSDILQPAPQHDWSSQFANLYIRDSESSSVASSVFSPPITATSSSNPLPMFNSMGPSNLQYSQQPPSNLSEEKHAASTAALDQAFADAFDTVFQDIHPVASELEDVSSPPQISTTKEKELPDNQTSSIAENDALSRTAGELYDKLNNDASDKFKNSNFLTLMRKLRDKQVVVDNCNLVESETIPFAASSFDLSAKELASNGDEELRTTDWEENFF